MDNQDGSDTDNSDSGSEDQMTTSARNIYTFLLLIYSTGSLLKAWKKLTQSNKFTKIAFMLIHYHFQTQQKDAWFGSLH